MKEKTLVFKAQTCLVVVVDGWFSLKAGNVPLLCVMNIILGLERSGGGGDLAACPGTFCRHFPAAVHTRGWWAHLTCMSPT